MIFDWITPLVGLSSRLVGKHDFWGVLPPGRTGVDVYRALKRAGCHPVRSSLAVQSNGEFVIAVDDVNVARWVLVEMME